MMLNIVGTKAATIRAVSNPPTEMDGLRLQQFPECTQILLVLEMNTAVSKNVRGVAQRCAVTLERSITNFYLRHFVVGPSIIWNLWGVNRANSGLVDGPDDKVQTISYLQMFPGFGRAVT
jgi:hypothetical protein